ncbi:MAG: hypothetical protein BWZ03_00821 [bacterium ADurb.BinA186]|nr:MAG: hypothetical protein BWZ03_00821 [bacterium ADurb.BinA186]
MQFISKKQARVFALVQAFLKKVICVKMPFLRLLCSMIVKHFTLVLDFYRRMLVLPRVVLVKN